MGGGGGGAVWSGDRREDRRTQGGTKWMDGLRGGLTNGPLADTLAM